MFPLLKTSDIFLVFYQEEKVDRKVPAFKPKGKVLCQQSQSAKLFPLLKTSDIFLVLKIGTLLDLNMSFSL
jgi:hypothetical protein